MHSIVQSFAEVTTWSPDGPGAWMGTVSPEWMQGRGSFGGIAAAVGLRAIRSVCADDRRPRSIHIAFLGPLTDAPARATAQVLRQGRFVTHARAEIWQGDDLRTQVTATLGDDRASSLVLTAPRAPERPAPQTLQALPHIEGVTPSFVRFLDLRWTDGAVPFSGAAKPGLGGWCRHRTDPGDDPYAALLGLLDAWPSPVVPMLRKPAPASSVSWSTTFFDVPPAISTEDFWWYGSEALAAGHGYAGMRASLYGPSGQLAGTVDQMVAIFDQPR